MSQISVTIKIRNLKLLAAVLHVYMRVCRVLIYIFTVESLVSIAKWLALRILKFQVGSMPPVHPSRNFYSWVIGGSKKLEVEKIGRISDLGRPTGIDWTGFDRMFEGGPIE